MSGATREQAVNHEAMAQVDNLGSADAAEARDAFLQRRPATFAGAGRPVTACLTRR